MSLALNALKGSMGEQANQSASPANNGDASQAAASASGSSNADTSAASANGDAGTSAAADIAAASAATTTDNTTNVDTTTATATATDTARTDNDLDDAALLEVLRKRTGRADLSSLDDLLKPATATPAPEPTDEERTKLAQKFRNDSLKFGLDKGLYDASTLETFHVEKAKPAQQIALESFREAVLESDPEMKERYKADKAGVTEEIQDLFEDRFGLNEEPTSVRYKMGQREIGNIADNYLNSKYGVILGAEDAFTQELDTRQRATTYKTTVDKVASAQSDRLETTIDGHTFSFVVPESIRTEVKNQLLLPQSFAAFGSAEINEAAVSSAYSQAVFTQVWPQFVAEISKAYHAEQMRLEKIGRLHAPVTTDEGGSNQNRPVTTGQGSKALNQMKGNMRQQPA